MAKFKKQETKEHQLLYSVEGDGKVWVKTSFNGGDIDTIMTEGGSDAIIHSPISITHALIEDWNIEDDNGNKLKINRANVAKLDSRDIVGIIETSGIKDTMQGGKKKSEDGEEQK